LRVPNVSAGLNRFHYRNVMRTVSPALLLCLKGVIFDTVR
jgi:hypothetical protein